VIKSLSENVKYENVMTMLDSPLGQNFYQATKLRYSMLDHFEAQRHGAYCGIASAVIGLNCYYRYFFSSKHENTQSPRTTQKIYSKKFIYGKHWKYKEDLQYGLTIDQIHESLRSYIKAAELPITVEKVSLEDPSSLFTRFRKDLVSMVATNSESWSFIIVNFWRNFKGFRAGHFVPIGSYYCPKTKNKKRTRTKTKEDEVELEEEEQVLLLDVALHRTKPHYIPLKTLCYLMVRPDNMTSSPRGYLLLTNVSKNGTTGTSSTSSGLGNSDSVSKSQA